MEIFSRLSVTCLESFRCADIYSLGLLMWEVCRRCVSNGIVSDYSAPYSEWLPSANQEPTVEEMKKLVCLDQLRPPMPNRWHSDEVSFENFLMDFIKRKRNADSTYFLLFYRLSRRWEN